MHDSQCRMKWEEAKTRVQGRKFEGVPCIRLDFFWLGFSSAEGLGGERQTNNKQEQNLAVTRGGGGKMINMQNIQKQFSSSVSTRLWPDFVLRTFFFPFALFMCNSWLRQFYSNCPAFLLTDTPGQSSQLSSQVCLSLHSNAVELRWKLLPWIDAFD